jgi:peptidoglycan/LPS O-acetylase OafA/YrhL
LNFAALATLFSLVQPWTVKWLGRGPAVVLGQASLEVFCAHLLVCFAALALVGDGTNAPVALQAAIIVFAMLFLYFVAKAFAKPSPKIVVSRED